MELAELAVQRWQNHEVLAALHGIEPRHTHQWPRSSSLLPRVSTCSRSGSVPRCRLQGQGFAGRRVHHSPQAAAPAATPSAQRVGSASCMSRYRPIRVSCFAAGAGHPAPGLPAERRQPPHPGKSITCLEKKKKTFEKVKKGGFARQKRAVCSTKKGKRETNFVIHFPCT